MVALSTSANQRLIEERKHRIALMGRVDMANATLKVLIGRLRKTGNREGVDALLDVALALNPTLGRAE
jgi:hypothetical protein